ncbi:MAG: hypothetical protein RR235_08955 [Oscillospiraceae bacterium]
MAAIAKKQGGKKSDVVLLMHIWIILVINKCLYIFFCNTKSLSLNENNAASRNDVSNQHFFLKMQAFFESLNSSTSLKCLLGLV